MSRFKFRGKEEISFALVQTVPVLLGYLCMGSAFGLMLHDAGYHFLWALVCSIFIYAGSMQFVLVTLLTSGASLIYSAIITLFINGRQMFYGLSLLDKFKGMGKAYPYMICSITDETYTLLCNVHVPEKLDEKKVYFCISLFDHLYWIAGCVGGAIIGELFKFNTTGVDFSMTALFIVIIINQWKETKSHVPVYLGALVALVFLFLLGPDYFLLPSMLVVCLFLVLFKKIIVNVEGCA